MVVVNDVVGYMGNSKQRTDVGYKYVEPFPLLLNTIKIFQKFIKNRIRRLSKFLFSKDL